jgi:hypothetical protein
MKGMKNMINDRELIERFINMREDDELVIPMYVNLYGKYYAVNELDKIKVRFTPTSFKIGFGTADALFMNNSFPTHRISEFDFVDVFNVYDSNKERNIRYTIFESSDVEVKEDDKLTNEIHKWFEILFNHVKEIVDSHFKSLVDSDTVPIIPKEKEPEKVETKDDEEESIFEDDPEDIDEDEASEVAFEFGDTEDEEGDPLEELRKEVAEYSQDDSETVSDDYLSEGDGYPKVTEGGLIGKETVDFINGEGKYSDDNDYSTDFDIF